VLAIIAVLPLLLPAAGIWAGSVRSWTWGGYLAMLYFVVGIMEAWSNPPQRWPALIQVALVVAYVALTIAGSRSSTEHHS
jgi:uncharacterized membrane protein